MTLVSNHKAINIVMNYSGKQSQSNYIAMNYRIK